MQNVTSSTAAVRSAAAALQAVFESTGTQWPGAGGPRDDLTTTAGAWVMLTGGYYDQAGIPASEAFRTMLSGYIIDAATAADLDYAIDTDADEHVDVSLAVCAISEALKAAAVDVFDSAPGSFSSTDRTAAVKSFFDGDTSETLNGLVTESIIVGVRMICEADMAEILATV